MKLYIAGPMTGYVELNFPAFNAEAARLRALGFEIVDELLNAVIRGLPNPGLPTIAAIVQRLRADWQAETMP